MKRETVVIILRILFWIAAVAIGLGIACVIAQLVWGSNLPEWLKVLLIAL